MPVVAPDSSKPVCSCTDGSFVSASGSEMLAMESLEQTEVSDKPVGIQDADTGRPNAASDNSVYDTEPWENK